MFGLRRRQLLLIGVCAAVLFAAYQYVPAYVTAFQFNDFVRQQVKYAGSSRKTTDTLREEVFRKANELGIGLTKKDIRITRHGPAFTLELEYRWPIDMKVYRHELVFRSSQTGELFENASD
jgi:hypothetical protein